MDRAREVWSAYEAEVSISEEDASGNVLSPALYEGEFVQGVSVKEIRIASGHRQPGATAEDRRGYVVGYEVQLDALLARSAEQVAPFEGSTGRFRVAFTLINPRYPGTAGMENEAPQFSGARVIEGPDWKYAKDGLLDVSVRFFAEGRA